MAHTVKFAFIGSLFALISVFVVACCCGGRGSSSDFDELFEDLADASTTGSTAFGATCNTQSSSQCTEYTEGTVELLGEDFYKSMCDLTSGTWGKEKCPTENLVGSCDDGFGSVIYYYSTGDIQYTADMAKSGCDVTSGTWKAGS